MKANVLTIKEGDLVDLESCPHLRLHPTAAYEEQA